MKEPSIFDLLYRDQTKQVRCLRVLDFLRENRRLPEEYRQLAVRHMYQPNATAGEKIFSIVLACLNAGPSPRIDDIGSTAKQIKARISKFNDPTLMADEFLGALKVDSASELISHFRTYPGIDAKTAALIVRELHTTQSLSDSQRLFGSAFLEQAHLQIPLDSVIACAINHIFQFRIFHTTNCVSQKFAAFNQFWKRLLLSHGDFMIIEDLWFWGRFCFIGGGIHRTLGINAAKYHADRYSYPRVRTPGEFRRFVTLVKNVSS